MKLSTKIMMTLAITGMVCIASIIALVQATATTEEYIELSETVTKIQLPKCQSVDLYLLGKNDECYSDSIKDENMVHFSNNYSVYYSQCDTLSNPIMEISETLADNIILDTRDDVLNIRIAPKNSYYNTIPGDGIKLIFPSFPKKISSSFATTGMSNNFYCINTDSLTLTFHNIIWPEFQNDTINSLSILNANMTKSSAIGVKLHNSFIDTYAYRAYVLSEPYTGCDFSDNSQINKLILKGADYRFSASGNIAPSIYIEPDSDSYIRLSTNFTYYHKAE